MIRLTRRYAFCAAHVLARAEWDPQKNAAIYGKCANPAGHGHNYGLEVTLRGEIDPVSGRLIALEELDRIVRERILDRVDHRFLNHEVLEFHSEVPTAENIARFAWRALAGAVGPAVLDRIRLVETENNAVEYSEGGTGG